MYLMNAATDCICGPDHAHAVTMVPHYEASSLGNGRAEQYWCAVVPERESSAVSFKIE